LLQIRELWTYRELLWTLASRDIKVRYKQTLLGMAWAVLQPVIAMAVFTLSLGRLDIPSAGIPYPLFVYTGLVVWFYFAESVRRASESLVENAALVSKIYFPRQLAPLAGCVSPLADLVVGLGILVVLLIRYDADVDWTLVLVPLIVLWAGAAAFAFGLWASALNVRYRDVRHAIPTLVQLGLFITPLVYPLSALSPRVHSLFRLNPMVGVVEAFRDVVLGRGGGAQADYVTSLLVTAAVLISGFIYFHKVERTFADHV
jgi:lipopolysaccharide transport system permease protein